MKIIRKKRIYIPTGEFPWAQTHAMNPTVDVLNDRVLRIYFSSLDENKVGRIGYVDLSAENPEKILNVSKEPVLDIGIKGAFDDNGVVPSSIVNHEGIKYLFYYGFQLVKQVRFLLFTGLAISKDDGKSYTRHSSTPLLDRTQADIYVRSLPFALHEQGLWKIWYSGVNEWTLVNGKEVPVGNLRYVESNEVSQFNNQFIHTCLKPEGDEFSLSRACVYKMDHQYRMLFSCRMKSTDSYHLGHAVSEDGIVWQRNDQVLSISPSHSDWDSEMMCYASLIRTKNNNFLFYNGNGFGASGFGYAEVSFN